MRIATFEADGAVSWGVVVTNPADGVDYIYEPKKTERAFKLNDVGTNIWFKVTPTFLGEAWPDTVRELLEMENGMETLHAFERFLVRYLTQYDGYLVTLYAHKVSEVKLRAPIPDPQIMFGLVSNSPWRWRNKPGVQSVNIVPQGHQRPIGSVVGAGEVILKKSGFNVEFGVIIGKEGRDIPIEEAYKYIAGYTVVIDSQINELFPCFDPDYDKHDIEEVFDWGVGATCSWLGKMADAHCAVGPYLVTPDEVGNPYDLLVYTLQDGKLRDRSHTAGMSIGIERLIHWMSTFMTVKPGDILHMGTVGSDGMCVVPEMRFGRENTIGSSIESVGEIHVPVLDIATNDWRIPEMMHPYAKYAPRDDSIRDSWVPAVGDFLRRGMECLERAEDYRVSMANSFFTCYGNYRRAMEMEGFKPTPLPRMLNGPARSLGQDEVLTLARRAGDVYLSVELCVVIKRLASRVRQEDAADYILGFAAMVSASDTSFEDDIFEPMSQQEAGVSRMVYQRWGDHYNTLGQLCPYECAQGEMRMTAEGLGSVQAHTQDYLYGAPVAIEMITRNITLFPGDVITLGRVGERILMPKDVRETQVNAYVSDSVCRLTIRRGE